MTSLPAITTPGESRGAAPIPVATSNENGPHLAGAGIGRRTSDLDPESGHGDIKKRTTRGAVVSLVSQATSLLLRTGSMLVLARLLTKEDFGLVNMVTAFTGLLSLCGDLGLSLAAVQRPVLTQEEASNLFWINVGVGVLLCAIASSAAPALILFYHEPKLLWIAVLLGISFIFTGAAAQHRALLQRHMRFLALAAVDVSSLIAGTLVGVALAVAGAGYWALAAMVVAQPAANLTGSWLATRWRPGRPHFRRGMGSMLIFGGASTLNGIIVYLAYNADKVLVGRLWGPGVLGVYGRGYQLINLPTSTLNSTLGLVAFPALSRLQHEPAKLARYFVTGYSLFLSAIIPITLACALFADDIIRVLLGPKWSDAAPIFRLLSPTVFSFALINPFGWLLLATGRPLRSLALAVAICPTVMLGYFLGITYGAQGVAAGFSIAMMILVPFVIFWSKKDTLITTRAVAGAMARPLGSGLFAAVVTWCCSGLVSGLASALVRLMIEFSILFGVYGFVFLFVFKQWPAYASLLRDITFGPKPKETVG